MTRALDITSFLSSGNGPFLARLYARYLADPDSVDASWRRDFDALGDDAAAIAADLRGPSWAAPLPGQGDGFRDDARPRAPGAGIDIDAARGATLDSVRALMLVRAYRVRGHLMADLDPLGIEGRDPHPELEPASYGFGPGDLDRPIFIDHVLGLDSPTMREILDVARKTYCSTIGYEFMHNQDPDEKSWIQVRIEGDDFRLRFSDEDRRRILRQLVEAEAFERFLQTKYTGTKRFGVEGAESLIPLLDAAIQRAAEIGVEEIVLGMPHRGRLNVLANIMLKPYHAIFAEFQGGAVNPQDIQGSGDVKYHLGTSVDRDLDGNLVHLSLTANPSHLEAVNPVVNGKVRAKQAQRGDRDRKKVMSILMHGDAAFAGQGLVTETLGLSELDGYKTGGTMHVIVNNQIGFTTRPSDSRSSPYPSDVAKGVQSPIFHVNGDDPEAVVHAARLATDYRQAFGRDVVVDMFCYRRAGHNEIDEPAFTQPAMYKRIAELPTTRQTYEKRLIERGTLTAAEAQAGRDACAARLESEFEAAAGYKPNKADWLEGRWAGLRLPEGGARRGKTEVAPARLLEIGRKLVAVPPGFTLHRTVRRMLEAKARTVESGAGIDWATAEALAFGALLLEGYPVRLSGQDSGRGTFSQRHSVWRDQENERRYAPLNHLAPGQAPYEVVDSMLSEAGVLGFEYGYSLAEPNALVLWEAQFGDFANGAQVIFDQFIASGESKWLRMCGLVVLLPHGYEGQGPEHSSARLERYLQLCAEDNIQVANCTSPANYFHILRRQLHRDFRKPLVLLTPKSLLRHKLAVSELAHMGPGTSFHRVLWDDAEVEPDAAVRRVVLCSGKVYYDLFERRAELGVEDVYLMRVEQLYPFPHEALSEELSRFRQAEILWCQEESQNQGAWFFVAPRLERVLAAIEAAHRRARYVGRPESASPASGLYSAHMAEQRRLVDEALTG